MGAHFEALDEGVLLVPLDPRYTQVGFNLISVQVLSTTTADLLNCTNLDVGEVLLGKVLDEASHESRLSNPGRPNNPNDDGRRLHWRPKNKQCL